MIYMPTEVEPASVFAHHCKLLYTKPMLTGNCSVTRQTQLHFRHRAAKQFWLDRGFSYKRLSQLALDLMASPASQAYVERLFSLCILAPFSFFNNNLTARKRNKTRMSEYRRVFLKLNPHILH